MKDEELKKRYFVLTHRDKQRFWQQSKNVIKHMRPDLPETCNEFYALVSGLYQRRIVQGG